MSKPPTAPEVMDRAAAEPDLDEMLRRDPRKVSDDELRLLVGGFRQERAVWRAAEAGGKKDDPKGGDSPSDENGGN